MLGIERGGTRQRLVDISLWKKLWNCRKTDCGVMNALCGDAYDIHTHKTLHIYLKRLIS